MSEIIKDVLRAVASSLQIPTIIILLLLILATIVLLGTFIAEFFTERKALKVNIPALIDEMQGKNTTELDEVVSGSGLLKRQKEAAHELIVRIKYPNDTREALARQIISDEESRYNKITKFTDIIARVAPMFGLMGTLIPLGPGLIALAQGDTKTLSESLLIAFDTTVAGLISAAVAYVISGIRKGWYEKYMVGLETIMETILEEQNRERLKAYRALQKKQTAKEDAE
ncbi:MAG: MotA/TolQ/ExbB proton channel family protein [Lentihominibacter sp.]|nr:MotA/TolQ/ExbB proton channel family protein [Bacillota bacterium]